MFAALHAGGRGGPEIGQQGGCTSLVFFVSRQQHGGGIAVPGLCGLCQGQRLLHQHMLTLSVHTDDRADAAGILLHLFLSLIFILIHDLNSFLTAAAAVIGQCAGARVIDIAAFPTAIRHPEITHHL